MLNKVHHGDCLDMMSQIPDRTVDMILCDLPYGTTQNKWDIVIPFDLLWEQYKRITKPNAAIVLTATQPFSSQLVLSNPKMFKYEWIWEKTVGSGQLNINKQPLRTHEAILIFYKKPTIYNQQMEDGAPYKIKRDAKGEGYGKQSASKKNNTGYRHPKSVLKFANARVKGGHPTQKPVELFAYLIRTYTNPGAIVLDNCLGSGTTAVACLLEGRQFIGIEKDKKYVTMANNRILQTSNEIGTI